MTTIEVFDPPMCCSTGVCGPSVDPALATFAADLGWLADQGVAVERHNLSQEPKAFAENVLVRELLSERGEDALPTVLVDGALSSSGRYPSRSELAAWSIGEGGPRAAANDAEPAAVAAGVVNAAGGCCGGSADQEVRLGALQASGGSGCCG